MVNKVAQRLRSIGYELSYLVLAILMLIPLALAVISACLSDENRFGTWCWYAADRLQDKLCAIFGWSDPL